MQDQMQTVPAPRRAPTTPATWMTTRDVAVRYGVPDATVRRVMDRIGIGNRVGRYRVVEPADLPVIEIALRAVGCSIP